MELIHHRHSLVLAGAGHVPSSLNHRFLVASGIIPADSGWAPVQEVTSEREARLGYPNGFWLHVVPERATFGQEAALPVGDPRTASLGEFADIVEGYHETFPCVAYRALVLSVDLMLDADPRTVLPGLLADPGRWELGDYEPLGLNLTQRYRVRDGVLAIALCPAVVTPPPPAPPQPKVAVSASVEVGLPEGLSRAQLRRRLEQLPFHREMVMVWVDQLLG